MQRLAPLGTGSHEPALISAAAYAALAPHGCPCPVSVLGAGRAENRRDDDGARGGRGQRKREHHGTAREPEHRDRAPRQAHEGEVPRGADVPDGYVDHRSQRAEAAPERREIESDVRAVKIHGKARP